MMPLEQAGTVVMWLIGIGVVVWITRGALPAQLPPEAKPWVLPAACAAGVALTA